MALWSAQAGMLASGRTWATLVSERPTVGSRLVERTIEIGVKLIWMVFSDFKPVNFHPEPALIPGRLKSDTRPLAIAD